MVPVISIVGKSDSGKTTLIEKLVPELISRGYRVGTIKHDAHQFDIDHPGKDTWRHRQAGARIVLISSPAKVAVVADVEKELTLDQIATKYFSGVDIVITEGYKSEAKPKIEVLADGDRELISPADEIFLVASDQNSLFNLPTVIRDDVRSIADAVEARFLTPSQPAADVELVVDDQPIALKPIMKAMVGSTVVGLISTLKGVDDPECVEIRIQVGRRVEAKARRAGQDQVAGKPK